MSYFFDRIMNESFRYGSTSLSSKDMYEIDSQITDDPISMYNYTSECINNIYKIDAAYARFESMNIVSLLEAKSRGDSYKIQQLSYTMEGAVGDMIQKIKEWIKKAYEAIKKFLKKCWTKLKTRIDIIRGQIGKYEDVLKNRDLSGCKIKWVDYEPSNVFRAWDEYNKLITNETNKVKNAINEKAKKEDLNIYKKGFLGVVKNDKFIENNIKSTLAKAGLKDGQDIDKNLKPKEKDVEFTDKAEEIFSIVGKDPVQEFNNMYSGGENELSAALKDLEEAAKRDQENREEEIKNEKDDLEKEKNQVKFDFLKNAHTFKVQIYRRFSTRLNEVLNARTAQCVAACKKAIAYAHENSREQKEDNGENKEKTSNSGVHDSYMFGIQSFDDMIRYM